MDVLRTYILFTPASPKDRSSSSSYIYMLISLTYHDIEFQDPSMKWMEFILKSGKPKGSWV